jgi:ATP-dependent RNA helicase RhlE
MPLDRLQDALRAAFGHAEPTAIQREALPVLLGGRDLLAIAPTGTGKTAAALLPVLHQLATPGPQVRALVLAPTRELAEQTAAAAIPWADAVGVRVACLVGGVPHEAQRDALAAGVDLVVATPGRLLDLHGRGHLSLDAVAHLVVDEADRLLDLGFLPDLLRIASRLPARHQAALFSATFPDPALAEALLTDAVLVDVGGDDPPLDRIDQHVLYVRKEDKHQLLAHVLDALPRALVFVRTRAAADRAVELLASRGRAAVALHGDLSQARRRAALRAFLDEAEAVLIATDVAARGLHVPNLHHVVNFDLPSDADTYVHRVGRTARNGASGVALSFCDPSEHTYLQRIEARCGRPLQPQVAHPFHDWGLVPAHPSARKGKGARRRSRRR